MRIASRLDGSRLAAYWSQKHCHVDGQMEDVIGAHDILCVENIGLTYFRGKLCAEFVQRCVAAVVAGLYFDGGYFFALGNQEIDLHVVFPMLLIAAGVEVELMPTAPEHLCHHVLYILIVLQ